MIRRRFLFLNDSTSPDGAQEYAVIVDRNYLLNTEGSHDPHAQQVESATFGWMTEEKARELLERYARGEGYCDPWETPITVERPEVHRRCGACT